MNYQKRVLLLLLTIVTTIQTSNAALRKIGSINSFASLAAGEDTSAWQDIKAAAFLITQAQDILKIKDDTIQLLESIESVIQTNLAAIKAIALKKDLALVKKIDKAITTLKGLAQKNGTKIKQINLQNILNPELELFVTTAIAELKKLFADLINELPETLQQQLAVLTKGKIAPTKPAPLTRKESSNNFSAPESSNGFSTSESSDWDDSDRPITQTAKPPLTKKKSFTQPRSKRSSNLKPLDQSNKKQITEIDPNDI